MRRFFSWLGSDWRLPITALVFVAFAFACGWQGQLILNLLDEDSMARREGVKWVETVTQEEREAHRTKK